MRILIYKQNESEQVVKTFNKSPHFLQKNTCKIFQKICSSPKKKKVRRWKSIGSLHNYYK